MELHRRGITPGLSELPIIEYDLPEPAISIIDHLRESEYWFSISTYTEWASNSSECESRLTQTG